MKISLSTSSAAMNANIPYSPRKAVAGLSTPSAESVSISDAANEALKKELAARGITNFNQAVSRSVHADPEFAEKAAYEMAHSDYAPWLDFSEHINGTGPIKYAASGLPVTESSESYFNGLSATVLGNKIDLYNTERAKGTPAADIFDKLIAYMDGLPEEYKSMINWQSGNFA